MSSIPPVGDRLIVALDVPTGAEAVALARSLTRSVRFFKIGLQLFIKEGPDIVHRIKELGARIFLDLKLFDIPNTVAKAVESAGALDVDFLTIHLGGGAAMIRAAATASASVSPGLQLLGVTVLTSSGAGTLEETGVTSPVADQVLRLAALGQSNGMAGVIASPQEIASLRHIFSRRMLIVTPGVRPGWAEANDQQRTLTPEAAVKAGADYLVVGRPITAHKEPNAAAEKILEEMAAGFDGHHGGPASGALGGRSSR